MLKPGRASGGSPPGGPGKLSKVSRKDPESKAVVSARDLPSTRWFDVDALPDAARRELDAHLRSLGVGPTKDPVSALANAELSRGVALDSRVTAADMARAVQRATLAQTPLKFAPIQQRNLFGFTAMRDAKFKLTNKVLSHLAEEAMAPPNDGGDLRVQIKTGPGKKKTVWQSPKTKVDVVASMVREMVLKGESVSLALNAELRDWLAGTPPNFEGALHRAGVDLSNAMGGAGGFCADLCSALPNTQASYVVTSPIHARVADQFSDQVHLVGLDGQRLSFDDATSDASELRVNFAADYTKGDRFELLGRSDLIINRKLRPLEAVETSRIILASPSQELPRFGNAPQEGLARLAKDNDTFLISGIHHLTKMSPEICQAESELIASQLEIMGEANPNLVRHFEYVSPKIPRNEPILLTALRGRFDSIGLNSVELGGALYRLSQVGAAKWKGVEEPKREEAEEPSFMVDAAQELKSAMGISRVHVHGLEGDFLLLDRCEDPERQVLALLRARQVAAMKCANASGEIRSSADLWPLAPVVKGTGLAALHRFADALVERYGLDDKARQDIVERWWFRTPTGETMFFVPNRDLHDTTGGTVSTGDTIDCTALIYGLEKSAATKKLLHPASF